MTPGSASTPTSHPTPSDLVHAAASAVQVAYGPATKRKAALSTEAVLRELHRYFAIRANEYQAPGAEQVVETYEAVMNDLLGAANEIAIEERL